MSVLCIYFFNNHSRSWLAGQVLHYRGLGLGSPEQGKQPSLVHGKQRRKGVPYSDESTILSSCRTRESLVVITGIDLSEGSRNQLVEEWRGEEGPTPNTGSLLQRRREVLDQIASLLTLR